MVCVRQAWLTLGSLTLQLEDMTKGYWCETLDLGSPAVREVVSNRPDQNGVDDRTMYMGARTITADIKALQSVGGAANPIDAVATAFAPFMDPGQRPVLHYVLDRPGTPERQITVRAADYGWPISGPYERDVHLAFVAADPVMRDATQKTATAWAGSGSGGVRVYNLTFNRTYPGSGTSPTNATIAPLGDVGVRPLFRIYGPATAPAVNWYNIPSGQNGWMRTVAGYQVFAGHYLDINSATKTAFVDGDPNQPAMASIDWQNSQWPLIGPAPAYSIMTLSAGSPSAVTQVQAMWRDGYLT
jgi:hypothetical protein